jgi:hypothetical protein
MDRRATGDHKTSSEADPVKRGTSCPNMAEHEAEHRQSGQVDMEAVAPEGDVVTEPGRHLRCVRHATDPRQGGHVIERAAIVKLNPHAITQTGGYDPRSQDVLHRLTQPQVGGQREGGDQLGQPEAGVAFACFR